MVEVVHDFAAAGIARDIQVVGNRLTAVVGGRVSFGTDAQFGPTQWDSGGVVYLVDLDTGEQTALDPGARLFRRPAISPAGDAVVAEGYPLIITVLSNTPLVTDTVVGRSADLFLYRGQ